MLIDITSPTRDVRFNQDFIDFAFAESGRISESKMLLFENKHQFPVEITWALLNVLNKNSGQWVKNPFRIRPETCKVEAGQSMNFTVEFAPFVPDQYLFQTAQCFIAMCNGGMSKNKRIIAQEAQR